MTPEQKRQRCLRCLDAYVLSLISAPVIQDAPPQGVYRRVEYLWRRDVPGDFISEDEIFRDTACPDAVLEFYRQALLHTDSLDLDNTVDLINASESLRCRSPGYGRNLARNLRLFSRPNVLCDLISMKDAFLIPDENFEYHAAPGTRDSAAGLVVWRGLADVGDADVGISTSLSGVDIRDHDSPVLIDGRNDVAAFHVRKNERARHAFNQAIQPTVCVVTDLDVGAAEYEALKKEGCILPCFPIESFGYAFTRLAQGLRLGGALHDDAQQIFLEAHRLYGVTEEKGAGADWYRQMTRSVPAVRLADPKNDRIVLIFPVANAALGSGTHVSIEMPFSLVFRVLSLEFCKKHETFKALQADPLCPQKDLTLPLADAALHALACSRTLVDLLGKNAGAATLAPGPFPSK